MQCKSCNDQVPAKFAHSIAVNICPLCGGEIMPIKLKNILAELKVALGDAKDYMDEVEDWLYSNFSLKKLTTDQMVVDKSVFDALEHKSITQTSVPAHGSPFMVNRREDVSGDVVVDEKPASIFHKRAGVINPKKAIDFIKGRTSSGAADPSEFQGVDDEYGEMNDSIGTNLNPLNMNEQKAMANMFAGNDLGNTSQELELQKLKRLQAQSTVSSGGGGGGFRRT